MEFQQSKINCMKSKISLAICIIRNKPDELSLNEYILLLKSNFFKAYKSNSDTIEQLKSALLEAKIELFYLKNKINETTLESIKITNDLTPNFSSSKYQVTSQSNNLKLQQNVEFISNIIKLKSLDKNFKLNDCTNETIMECLGDMIKQVNYFLFKVNENYSTSFPLDSLLHSVQIFLNIFDLEWFYYLRNNLADFVLQLIKNVVNGIINYSAKEKHDLTKLNFYCQILVTLSTSDYLLNHVIYLILDGINILVDYGISQAQQNMMNNYSMIENTFDNCKFVVNVIDSIVKLRLLENFTPIGNQTKSKINDLLNKVFISLTDFCPLVAIQISKIIQLLNISC